MFIFLQETQISFDLYAAVICVALKQNKHASELPLLGKNIPKDHDGIFPPVLPTSISVPPIDINLALFPSGNCVIFSIFLDNRLLFKMGRGKFLYHLLPFVHDTITHCTVTNVPI